MKRKAYRTSAQGVESIVFAETRGKARSVTQRSAADAGYRLEFTEIAVRRAPAFDTMPHATRVFQCWSPEILASLKRSYDDGLMPEWDVEAGEEHVRETNG